jgi:catechol 2,3-dioxygenase-like lactoylglutathione lyase family enzyme
MKFEHFAINVADVRTTTQWYVQHLGLKILRSIEHAPYTKFLADETDRVVIELYSNTTVVTPDYFTIPPLNFHIAFVAANAKQVEESLIAAGATLFKEETLPDGSFLVMMRDPWGVPLQFCQRTKPF